MVTVRCALFIQNVSEAQKRGGGSWSLPSAQFTLEVSFKLFKRTPRGGPAAATAAAAARRYAGDASCVYWGEIDWAENTGLRRLVRRREGYSWAGEGEIREEPGNWVIYWHRLKALLETSISRPVNLIIHNRSSSRSKETHANLINIKLLPTSPPKTLLYLRWSHPYTSFHSFSYLHFPFYFHISHKKSNPLVVPYIQATGLDSLLRKVYNHNVHYLIITNLARVMRHKVG